MRILNLKIPIQVGGHVISIDWTHLYCLPFSFVYLVHWTCAPLGLQNEWKGGGEDVNAIMIVIFLRFSEKLSPKRKWKPKHENRGEIIQHVIRFDFPPNSFIQFVILLPCHVFHVMQVSVFKEQLRRKWKSSWNLSVWCLWVGLQSVGASVEGLLIW